MAVNLKIDSREVQVPEGTTVLEAARQCGVNIPTLCNHPALEPYGACRLCVVEIIRHGRTRMVVSCAFPVEEGLEVNTATENVIKSRRFIIELLRSRCPHSTRIKELANELGVGERRLPDTPVGGLLPNCILCGLCIRVCADVIRQNAIGYAGRGAGRKVTSPFELVAEDCIGCGACAAVCPTGTIWIDDKDGKRNIPAWKTEFELVKCATCKKEMAPPMVLERVKGKTKTPDELLAVCPDCRRKNSARELLTSSLAPAE